MANTIVKSPGVISLTAIDTDWNFTTSYPGEAAKGIAVDFIAFAPAAAADRCCIKHAADSGAIIFDSAVMVAGAVMTTVIYFGGMRIKPFLDVSEGAFNAQARLIIKLAGGCE